MLRAPLAIDVFSLLQLHTRKDLAQAKSLVQAEALIL